MKQYIYVIRPARLEMLTKGASEAEASIVSEHFNYLSALAKEGTVLVFGRTQNRDALTFGLCIFRAESEEAARAVMNNDPAVKNGVMLAELFPYEVAGFNTAGWQAE